ncbi:hypothetical protein TL16_g03023 [Triparma laevis f. inornata]|uniref:Uncharacterized protein n=1 Tax=Triparma laevis f. inornata TaxID=1714386 RepID=A0A9W7A1I7_9STRA|nr:hypothetical protein TL16_g03023 [Triparma laevis f. inornata]
MCSNLISPIKTFSMSFSKNGPIEAEPKNKHGRDEKIRILYEEYISLHPVMYVWENPITVKPDLEPTFSAAMHGVELGFILCAEFISDSRYYVVKRPRVELIAEDFIKQIGLLAEIIDGELEDDTIDNMAKSHSLTQDFPFDGAPPTASSYNFNKARQSPALDMLVDAITNVYGNLSAPEKYSLRKVIRNITGAFQTYFGDWTVGIGLEEQLSEIRQLVGLPALKVEFGRRYLDYKALVRPHVIMDTFQNKIYEHTEDFFFRSVHLGTECWAFIALRRLESACKQLRDYSHWHNAAAHILSATHILSYLGDHIMMLTSMILRDYLRLKVEIEGTSGEGSSHVKNLRQRVMVMIDPLMERLRELDGSSPTPDPNDDNNAEDRRLLLNLYANPEKQPGLYSYAKALEAIESGLNGGFYYKHFCLASNVIGTGAKGTMKKSVQALKVMYERALFPNLDMTRSELGKIIDDELAMKKGKIMDRITEEHNGQILSRSNSLNSSMENLDKVRSSNSSSNNDLPTTAPSDFVHIERSNSGEDEKEMKEVFYDAKLDGSGHGNGAPPMLTIDPTSTPPPGCPFHVPGGNVVATPKSEWGAHPSTPSSPTPKSFDSIRRRLYSAKNVPQVFSQAYAAEMTGSLMTVSFLDHAWGKTPPEAHVAATKRQYALYQRGNSAWDVIFGDLLPEAITHIKWLLDVKEASVIEFGHNSHELVSRLLSIKLEKLFLDDADGEKCRILTTDTEFYSFTRQMNRLMKIGSKRIEIEHVPIEPISTFEERFTAKVNDVSGKTKWDMVYVSQCVYSTQETIVLDLDRFTSGVADALEEQDNNSCFFVIDGYHGFGAIPTSLQSFENVFYVSGMLKHVGSGANCAFLIVPEAKVEMMKPVFTGWIADPSVLAPESKGIKMGSDVGYIPGFSLMGGTPAFMPSLLIFVEVMRRWKEMNINVVHAHRHVMEIHRAFIQGIEAMVERSGGKSCWSGMRPMADEVIRSHSITFVVDNAETAKKVVELMRQIGDIEVDSRKMYVRFGFGFNHNIEDISKLLVTCEKVQEAIK